MSGKILTAMAAALLLASTALPAAAATTVQRHHRAHPRYYNMVPDQKWYDPAPAAGTDINSQPWETLRSGFPENGAAW